jgi:hypothetical protein
MFVLGDIVKFHDAQVVLDGQLVRNRPERIFCIDNVDDTDPTEPRYTLLDLSTGHSYSFWAIHDDLELVEPHFTSYLTSGLSLGHVHS